MTAIGTDSRQDGRKRMLKGGVIAFSGRHATINCVVRDMSESGARLQVKHASSVPDTFELIVDLDGLEVPVEVVWRTAQEIGVRYLGPPSRVAPKRAQTIAMTTPVQFRAKASLRKQGPKASAAAPPQFQLHRALEAMVPSVAPADFALSDASRKALQHSVPLIPVVVADDDPDDRMLIADAFNDAGFRHPVSFVENGEELLKYLRGIEPYSQRQDPGLVLLDLNMPRMDGRTALMHMKADAQLRTIPVIVMTTSGADEDIQHTYDLGVSAYIPKPNTQEGLLEVVEAIDRYWLRMVSLPSRS